IGGTERVKIDPNPPYPAVKRRVRGSLTGGAWELVPMTPATVRPWWAWAWPVLAFMAMLVATMRGADGLFAAAAGIIVVPAVFAAVFHAEVIAHRIGEPFGTLVLAVAVTVIEVALIVFIMLGVTADKAGLARDTVFAVVMIVCNGIVGL